MYIPKVWKDIHCRRWLLFRLNKENIIIDEDVPTRMRISFSMYAHTGTPTLFEKWTNSHDMWEYILGMSKLYHADS